MTRHSTVVFEDQGRKLTYLIRAHRDRRLRSRRNPSLALQPEEGGHRHDHLSRIVVDQETLAAGLGVAPSAVSRWSNERVRIPDPQLSEICRIYAIDEHLFRTASYRHFLATCRGWPLPGAAASPRLAESWRRLVAGASDRIGIWLDDPARGSGRRRPIRRGYATAASGTPSDLPEIRQSAPFWIEIVSPERSEGGSAWAGWHLLLLNRDATRDGFRSLLPRDTNDPTHWTAIYPKQRALILPHAPILRHEAPDVGEFEITAILTRDRMPATITDALRPEAARGLAIEAALEDLALWLEDDSMQGRSALVRVRYRVVEVRS